jgi:hypothetical protein
VLAARAATRLAAVGAQFYTFGEMSAEVLAYCLPESVRGGDTVGLHLSAPTPVAVEVVRDGAVATVVWRRSGGAAAALPVPDDAPEAGCGWPVAVTIPVDPSWPSGLYLVRCTPAGAASPDPPTAFFVVRAATPSPDGILLVLATTTWNAYNDVGGRNFYTGAVTLSFERPLAAGLLAKPAEPGERVATLVPGTGADAFIDYTARHRLSMWHAMAGWATWERRFAAWAEAAGYRVDFATSTDIGPELLAPYRLYLSVGHDEYWTAAMRDAVEGFVAGGGNAAFFSGNTCYWQIRLEGTREVCFKHRFREDPVQGPHTTTIWSDPLLARPETHLTGLSFTRGGYSRTAASVPAGSGGYQVHRPDHWLFAGTRLRRGDLLGAGPVVVGYECDGCELAMVDGLPVATGAGGTPAGFDILATAPATPFDRHTTPLPLAPGGEYELEFHAARLFGEDTPATRARLRHGHAVLGSYVRGGTVVTTGCTDWAYGLDDPVVARVTRNVLDRLGRPV